MATVEPYVSIRQRRYRRDHEGRMGRGRGDERSNQCDSILSSSSYAGKVILDLWGDSTGGVAAFKLTIAVCRADVRRGLD